MFFREELIFFSFWILKEGNENVAIITLGSIVQLWQNISDWSTSTNTTYKPKILKDGRQQTVLTTTPLGISATYASSTFDTLTSPQINMVCASCYTDQSGMLYLDVSPDGTNWNVIQSTVPISANIGAVMAWQNPLDRYFRIRLVNNITTAQTILRLSMTSTT